MPPSPLTIDQQQPPRKSHDGASVGSTFVFTADANGQNGHFDPRDRFTTDLRSGSLHSLAVGKPNGMPSGRDSLIMSDGHPVLPPITTPGLTTTSPEEIEKTQEYFETARISTQHSSNTEMTETTTISGSQESRLANGDRIFSVDSAALTPPTSLGPSSSLDVPTATASQNTSHLHHPVVYSIPPPTQPPPPPPISLAENTSAPNSPNRPLSPMPPPTASTLQVPPFSSRKSSRDGAHSVSEDHLPHGEREHRASFSSGFRRASLSTARRTSRSLHSDGYLEDPPDENDVNRRVESIKNRRASKRRRRDDDDDKVMVGTPVDQNHVNWVTAYNMLTGIRFTVSRTNAKLDRELNDLDFDAKQKFSFDITGNELTPSAKYDFKFKDYAPWVFRHLRQKFKIDPADYLMSLTSKYILSELGSPGKSGSFFYFSRDYKYIIKTIHHAEHKLLRRVLRQYYEHVEHNPNTLISQFYGLHRVKMAYGRKIHFVVMNNLFPPHRDIHQMFDLKGSTVGRNFNEDDLEHNPRATLKDLNWLRHNRRLHCGHQKKEIFMAQLKRDVGLLQSLNIMDYSLLVGVHDMTKGNDEKVRDKTLQVFQPGSANGEDPTSQNLIRTPSRVEYLRKAREFREMIQRERPVPLEQTSANLPDEILDRRNNMIFYSDDGGFRATHEDGQAGNEIYYIGVIDCLTNYGVVKKAENFWKGLSHDRDQISPIPPVSYGERFVSFIEGITQSPEECERQEEERRRTGDYSDRHNSVEHDKGKGRAREPTQHTLTTVPGNDSTVLPVVEEAGEASTPANGASTPADSSSIAANGASNSQNHGHGRTRSRSQRSEHASSIEIYENLMNGTTPRYELRLANGPPGPPPTSMPPPPPVNMADHKPVRPANVRGYSLNSFHGVDTEFGASSTSYIRSPTPHSRRSPTPLSRRSSTPEREPSEEEFRLSADN